MLLVVDHLPPFAAVVGDVLALLAFRLEGIVVHRPAFFDADVAAACRQRVDAGEQLFLRSRRKIDQQALGDPRRRLRRTGTIVPQGLWPVVTQVDGDLAPLGPGRGPVSGQRLASELQNLGLVEFENGCAGGPVEPVGPGVQADSQQHDLPDTGSGDITEVRVEVAGTRGLEVDEVSPEVRRLQRMLWCVPVQHGGPWAAGSPAEDLGVGVYRERMGFLRLQRAGGRDEQGGRADARGDVPGVVVSSHVRESTR